MAACPMTANVSVCSTSSGADSGSENLKRRKMDSSSQVIVPDWKLPASARAAHHLKFEFLHDQVSNLRQAENLHTRDDINYSQAWFVHYKRREHMFKPWNPTLGALAFEWEWLRVRAIQCFWRATKNFRINPVTIHLAVSILNRLLYALRRKDDSAMFTKERFAGIVAVSFRTALKFEERPESLWSIRKIWEVLPMFDSWNIDRTDAYLHRIEAEALRVADDCFDIPLSVQFFDRYLTVGGWPEDLVKEYTLLGHFLLALSTFAAGEGHPLSNVAPSKIAAAAVVLSVKIVNNDSRRGYEFFPKRFEAYTETSLKDLQTPIKGLSSMLRRRPEEARVLGRIYPEWGEHEWM